MSGGGSFSSLSVHVGSDFMVRCATYPDQVPILSLDAGDGAVMITPAGRDATDEALEFARALLRSAQAFAGEIERMHAARHATTGGTGAGSSGTGASHNGTADEQAA